MGSITVRVAHLGDAVAVQRITDAAFAPLRRIYEPSPTQRAHVAAQELERLVAIDGAHMVGTVRWRSDGDLLRVTGLAVEPTHQRRGVARTLLHMLAAFARIRGCRALALYTIEQTGNVSVFERLGFMEIWKERDVSSISVSGADLFEVYMERPLQAQ